jgi:hypothetical protein
MGWGRRYYYDDYEEQNALFEKQDTSVVWTCPLSTKRCIVRDVSHNGTGNERRRFFWRLEFRQMPEFGQGSFVRSNLLNR